MMTATDYESYFANLTDHIFANLIPDEIGECYGIGEQSLFIRLNQAKVRQTTDVEQFSLQLTLFKDGKYLRYAWDLSFDLAQDKEQGARALRHLRENLAAVPVDPFLVLPSATVSHRDVQILKGSELNRDNREEVISRLCDPLQLMDAVGLFTSGPMYRFYAHSHGVKSWFATVVHSMDFSLFNEKQQAVKGNYTDRIWPQGDYDARVE